MKRLLFAVVAVLLFQTNVSYGQDKGACIKASKEYRDATIEWCSNTQTGEQRISCENESKDFYKYNQSVCDNFCATSESACKKQTELAKEFTNKVKAQR